MLKTADSASHASGDSVESRTADKSLLMYAVIALGVLNGGFLIGLALFTSNPIVLNPHQFRSSSLIVSGSVESSGDRGVTISIDRIWKGSADNDTVFVRDLSAAQFEGSDVWILPLNRVSATEYIVTPRKNASAAHKPLLYPADPDTLNKLNSLLSPDDPSL